MKLKYARLLSNVAFKFNLRRYTTAGVNPADAVYEYFKSEGLFGGDASRPSEPLLPGVPLPAVGARVRCEGLTGAAELNGCLGRVVSHQGARAHVRMDGPGGRVVGLRPANLVVLPEGDSDFATTTGVDDLY